ncbi:Qat anti-phage system TatD family nuclease QatD [Sedimentibacter sp.]|uniref:Qat anti-phage system TatD family nuclease QatD n=1 Tax=Sedimentibacter sp. TaxID=1960295 RepID=UPI0028A28731|nr:Qat anti-phage system TatD family nuclease QatD [Sedimentibacter sp.]
MILYDMHCHLDLMPRMKNIIQESLKEELGILAVTTTPKAYKKEIEYCKDNRNIKVALGLHPQLVKDRYDELSIIINNICNAKYIGEIGLDFNKQYYASKEKQIEVFSEIIRMCSELGERIISIHSVKSAEYVLNILETFNTTRNNRCILHWFTGTEKQLIKAIELGCYFSVNKKMLDTERGRGVIRMIPKNKLLVETDAPFIQEITFGRDIYEELYQTINIISKLREEDLFKTIEENSQKIFR